MAAEANQTLFPQGIWHPIHDVAYSGTGRWSDAYGNFGNYDVYTSVQGQSVTTTYSGIGFSLTQVAYLSYLPGSNAFEVYAYTGTGTMVKVGDGSCTAFRCHYSAPFYGVYEELSFQEGYLYKVGTRHLANNTYRWEETLVAQ
jgi:hypothetical protein